MHYVIAKLTAISYIRFYTFLSLFPNTMQRAEIITDLSNKKNIKAMPYLLLIGSLLGANAH